MDNEPNQYVALLHINKLKVKDSDTVHNISIANEKGSTMYQFRIQKIKSKYVIKCKVQSQTFVLQKGDSLVGRLPALWSGLWLESSSLLSVSFLSLGEFSSG